MSDIMLYGISKVVALIGGIMIIFGIYETFSSVISKIMIIVGTLIFVVGVCLFVLSCG